MPETHENIIKSISYWQEEILAQILRLYIPSGRFDLDATYSKGAFYADGSVPKPILKFDLNPQREDCQKADCRHLPLASGSIGSMILDPPFLATTGKSLNRAEGNLMLRRFGVYPNEQSLQNLYRDAIAEAYRLLKLKGILVLKCQDKVSSGKQYMMHCLIYNWAVECGFIAVDLFVLLARSRLIANWQRNQKHARKYHSYFWVFEKGRKTA